MHVERLTKMAELMERVYEDGQLFSLACWKAPLLHALEAASTHCEAMQIHEDLTPEGQLLVSSPNFSTQQDVHDCGFAACAVGYAGLDPWFNEQGLVMDSEFGGIPRHGDNSHWDAVYSFFELEAYGHADHLFSANTYPNGPLTTAKEVADRIREFIAEHQRTYQGDGV